VDVAREVIALSPKVERLAVAIHDATQRIRFDALGDSA
jgi:hypothetical protein